MKLLNTIFNLLFPFLFLLRDSLTLKEQVSFKQQNSKHTKNKKLHHQFITFIIPILFFTLLVTSPLSAVTPGDDCSSLDSNNTVSTGTTSSRLNPADANTDDYFKFITGGPGELIVRFVSDEAIKFYASTDCPMTDYFIEVDPAKTEGIGLIALDTNTTIYIHAERTNKNAFYNFTIDFTPAPTKEDRPPNFCYDYAYEQNGVPFTEENNGTTTPYITGTVDANNLIDVEIYIQNLDPTDEMKDVGLNIFDINISQATYVAGSTLVTRPDEDATAYADADMNVSDSYINDIIIGDVEDREYFYVNYNIDPTSSYIDIPLNISLDYNVTYFYGLASKITYRYEVIIDNSIPICNRDNFNYTPAYGIFNMEDSELSYKTNPNGVYPDNGFYNLPTQTVNRVGSFVLASYEANDIYKRKKVYTPVAVELIDAGKYGGTATSCGEVDSALGPRIWVIVGDESDITNPIETERVIFNHDTITDAIATGQVSDQILASGSPLSYAEEFFSSARENTAFRLAYNGAGQGDLINLEPVPCKSGTDICYNVSNFTNIIDYNGGNCVQDVDGRPGNIDKIPQFCNNAGLASASAMTKSELAICMECVYGFDVNYLCSRDNFAIRPESYRMSLNDQKQTDTTQQSTIAINDDEGTNQDRNHTAFAGPYHVAAGYNYALQIRATNHENDNATPGYTTGFYIDGNDSLRTYRLDWSDENPSSTYCNDTTDHNRSLSIINGGADLNLSADQVGKYDLTIKDTLWTSVDWNQIQMTHHTTGQGDGYFLTGTDCVQNTSYVPSKNTVLTTVTGNNLSNVSGCDINSNNHVNIDTNSKYKDIALRVHPYKFDLNGNNPSDPITNDPIDPKIGPYTRTNGQTFVYINTPPSFDENNTNMSYNMNGTFFAAGYHDIGSLSNFVTGCYADDVDMNLTFTYNSPEPSADKTPFLSYSLKDHNTTDETDIYRPTSGYDFEVEDHNSSTLPFIIEQDKTFFVKDMRGAITMDLGYNFKRDYNKTLNPRYIEFHDFNITYVTNPSNIKADLKTGVTGDIFEIFGDITLDQNVTFVYGRAKPSQDFYDDVTADSINTPISIVVYCDQDPITCSAVYNIKTVLSKTDVVDWYLSRGHVMTDNDGNITLEASTGASVTSSVVINDSGGVDPDVIVTADVATRPLDVNITFGTATNRWLIYNKDNNTTPIPFYRVRFIGQNDWAGHGDTGHVVDSATSYKKNRRLEW